jgi:hypothetical protein
MVRAAMDGLAHLTTVEQVARERGIDSAALPYKSRANTKREAERPRHRKETV